MDELFKLLPESFSTPIKSRLNIAKLCEVRIVNGAPVRINYDGTFYYLCATGICKDRSSAFVASKNEAENVVMRACEKSLYTVSDTLKRGYVSVSGGIRIGVCGSGVTEKGELIAVKDFTSVNIRIPHEVKGCAAGLFAKISVGGYIDNTLIISPPGVGKTTVLRDLCRLVSERGIPVLLCDEKFELAAVTRDGAALDVGPCTDIISGTDKARSFEIGVANMSPRVVMADELFERDMKYVTKACACGISVVATAHAKDIDNLRMRFAHMSDTERAVWNTVAVLSGAPGRNITVYGDRPL